jgi:hypothetical protein
MKNLDSFDSYQSRMLFNTRLTCLLPFWNHPKTVALYFASGESLLNHATERSNFCSRISVKQG